MARTRVDVWNATDAEGDWPAVLEAYERAIATMRGLDAPERSAGRPARAGSSRPPSTGWPTTNGDPDTSNPFWCNCQHGSWFFLPWHRMYLAAFEQIIQFHLEDDPWALPYWYAIDPDGPRKAALPPAFLDLTLADNNLQTDERSQTAKAGLPFYGDIDPVQVGETVLQTLRAFRVLHALAAPPPSAVASAPTSASTAASAGCWRTCRTARCTRWSATTTTSSASSSTPAGWARSSPPGSTRSSGCTTATSTGCGRSGCGPTPTHVNPTGDPAFFDTTFTFPAPGGRRVHLVGR